MVSFQERRYRINPQMQDDKMKTRIKELRARYDLTQEDLANKVGVRRETIGFLEKGKYNPSLKLAYKVAITLETTIDELFIFDESDLK
ncbi:putative transcriptional regulator [Methanolobus tindarius DSM 2278]|jgi:DNA-binding XRE family transcriptional regulator|uniref:Putative transcriptional regulator n=2 Tax=Methanosarcinaceae TaxID=2206 RepID=W9DWL7_METTI|nr:putative transcriptional regulator [Methanolobus tindarius DSM 2278]